jgi:hypothetical protein
MGSVRDHLGHEYKGGRKTFLAHYCHDIEPSYLGSIPCACKTFLLFVCSYILSMAVRTLGSFHPKMVARCHKCQWD